MLSFQSASIIFNYHIIAGEIDYHSELDILKQLHIDVDRNEYTNAGSLISWFYSYLTWLENSMDSAVTSVLNAGLFYPCV